MSKPTAPKVSLETLLRQGHLPGYVAEGVMPEAGGYRIRLSLRPGAAACPHCGSAATPYAHGTFLKEVVDLPQFERPVRLEVSVPRYRCTECGKTYSATLPHIDPRRAMTLRLAAWIRREARRRTKVEIAAQLGITEGTVRAVLRDATTG